MSDTPDKKQIANELLAQIDPQRRKTDNYPHDADDQIALLCGPEVYEQICQVLLDDFYAESSEGALEIFGLRVKKIVSMEGVAVLARDELESIAAKADGVFVNDKNKLLLLDFVKSVFTNPAGEPGTTKKEKQDK